MGWFRPKRHLGIPTLLPPRVSCGKWAENLEKPDISAFIKRGLLENASIGLLKFTAKNLHLGQGSSIAIFDFRTVLVSWLKTVKSVKCSSPFHGWYANHVFFAEKTILRYMVGVKISSPPWAFLLGLGRSMASWSYSSFVTKKNACICMYDHIMWHVFCVYV